MLRTITIPCKIIKTNENYDFNLQMANLKSQSKFEKNQSKKYLIDLQIA
ncbi:hypothetical protein [Spiroplasma endosymbiont of Nebria brevicollis]